MTDRELSNPDAFSSALVENLDVQIADAPAAAPFPIPDNVYAVPVTEVTHYTDKLFRFRTERPQGLRFRSGEFVMIGLPNVEKPVYRAYSIASPAWDDELEFFSIKVPDGPLTRHLQKVQPGDTILVRKKPTGTLVLDALIPGKRLYLISTGTGIAPFASLIRDPETWEAYEQVILVHGAREVAELTYGQDLVADLRAHPDLGEMVAGRLVHYTATTREPYVTMGRVTTLIENGQLFKDLDLPPLNPDADRVMICGSMAMLKDTQALCEAAGLTEGANSAPGTYVIERAFVG